MATLTTNINYLQPTGFKIVIDRKRFGNLEYFAQSVSHPSVSIQPAPVSYSRVNLHMAGDKLTFGELTANIIIDESMKSYSEMFDWMTSLVENVNVTKLDKTLSREPLDTTAADITVTALSSHNNKVKNIRYIDCVPTDIGSIEFQATTSDIQYLTFPVTFSFSYFTLV